MKSTNPIFISFEIKNNQFQGFVSIDAIFNNPTDINLIILKAEKIYDKFIVKAKQLVSEIEKDKSKKESIRARSIWKLGDEIFKLTIKLDEMGLVLDRIYEHLSRDLLRNPKWFGNAVTFRRHVTDYKVIPISIKWAYFEKSIKKKALALVRPKS